MIVISPETRMMGLLCGEEIMIVGRTMWTQSTRVTDGQTDGRTDGLTDRITITDTVQTASHGKKGGEGERKGNLAPRSFLKVGAYGRKYDTSSYQHRYFTEFPTIFSFILYRNNNSNYYYYQ